MSVNAIARRPGDERNNLTKEFMSCPLERDKQRVELTGRK
jgi:hypothetical protein